MAEDDVEKIIQEVFKPTFTEFLTQRPPGNDIVRVKEFCEHYLFGHRNEERFRIIIPVLKLHCYTDECDDIRYFDCDKPQFDVDNRFKNVFLDYSCRHCKKGIKIFAVGYRKVGGNGDGEVIKIGEWPSFGDQVPSKTISLIGPDRELFLKGRRAENQGMGIAAFAYYRRVIENQRNRLIDEIIKVAKQFPTGGEMIVTLDAAKKETQFSSAVEKIKDALPEALLINGHNPMTLLYQALSNGLHSEEDEDCLAISRSIRVVLTELGDRLTQILKDQSELQKAVSELLTNRKK